MHASTFVTTFLPVLFAVSGVMGLVALVSPRAFGLANARCAHWFDSNRMVAVFDRRFDVDHYILRHVRVFGAVVVVAVTVLCYLLYLGR